MATIFGTVHNESGGPALGATVRAFDKDLRHEQLLGEAVITETAARYEIAYTEDQFRRSEKKSADLIVRAFDRDGNLRAESEIRFNARDNERIDLTFRPLPTPETPRLSELEQLQASIEPAREGVEYGDFTDADLAFLTEEVIRVGILGDMERRTVREHLGFLSLADQFTRRTDIPLAAFYGWFRQGQPQVLERLLDVSIPALSGALTAAIRSRIIPDITTQIPEILERLRSLRFEEGRLVNHRFVVRLIDAETGRPLNGLTVEVTDLAAEADDQDLGALITDGRGVCVIIFPLPGGAPESATRRLQLRVLDGGLIVAEAEVEARANQEEVAEISVSLRESEAGNAPIGEVAPPALAERLRREGVVTLRDLLARPDLTDDDAEGLERLRATAKFETLSPELGEERMAVLLDSGFRSPLRVGATSRAEFVRGFHERLGGDAATYITRFASLETAKALFHMIGSAWLQNVTTPGDEPDPDIPTGVNDVLSEFSKCGCTDCGSAISPAAYLAHLLEWTLEHIKDISASIAFDQLEEEFHQPFGDLPASCAAVDEQVRQARICVESLWRFTGFLDRTDLQMPTPFRNAYRLLRNQLYRGILTNLGTNIEQLRRATLRIQGDSLAAEQVASQRRALADLLGIDESHLDELFFNIEQPPISPSEDDLHQRFGFRSTRAADVFAAPGAPPDLIVWQRERLGAIWEEQDWPTDAYTGEGRLPFVDPDLISEAYLRAPQEANPAFALIEDRRAALAAHRQALVNQQPQQNGIVALLESELGQSIEQLRSLYETLQSNDPEADAIAQAHETIASLNLTPAGFTRLMEIDARLEAGEPVGGAQEEIDSAWESVLDILTRALRHELFPDWIEEENDLALVFGPKLFWLPVESDPPASSWRATPSERSEWEESLGRRGSRPIIDPDQIQTNHIILVAVLSQQGGQELGFTSSLITPPLQAITLWQQRRDWIDSRLNALQAARQNQANALETLQAALQASALGFDLVALEELAALEAEGRDIEPRLAQLSLTTAEYRFLAGIRELALGAGTVASNSWQEVDAILVQAEKRREFAEWRLAEQAAGITLHPHRFVAPEFPEEQDDSPQTRWLRDQLALQRWLDTLSARGDQLRALTDGLAEAVGKAEESVLPLLRNILIMQTVATGDSLDEKAEWLDKRLLIDMRMDGCQMTTRVSQAIETLQRFIRGVYTQEHLPLMQHLTLDAVEDYEAEWPVLGSYATWRAFMLAYLFPENLLHLSPPSRQSFGFTRLKNNLPSRIEPKDACKAAEEYSNYFQDVFHLDVQASCQVLTRVDRKEGCGATTAAYRSLVHLFALATTSGRVYTNNFEGYFDSEDTLDSWKPAPGLSNVLEIVGAVPHETPARRRLILLFVKARQASSTRLQFVAFDLDTNSWTKPDELDLPPGAGNDFSVVAVQKRHGSAGETLGIAPADGAAAAEAVPTILTIRTPNGRVYVRYLNAQATDWAGDSWVPLFGDLKSELYEEVCALIQRNRHEYMMIVRGVDGWLSYRIFSVEPVISKDDGFWRSIAKGTFAGATCWPQTEDVFVFYHGGGKTKYAVVGNLNEFVPGGYSVGSVPELNTWLISVVGVSLADFGVDVSFKWTWTPRANANLGCDTAPGDSMGDSSRPLHPKELTLNFLGNLFDLLTLTEDTWADRDKLPPGKCYEFRLPDEYYLQDLQKQGLAQFRAAIQQAPPLSQSFSQWKLADLYVRNFAEGKGLVSALEDAFFRTNLLDPIGAGEPEPDVPPLTRFRYRGFITESEPVGMVTTDNWHFISSGGDEEFGTNPRKAIAMSSSGAAFRMKLRRSDNALSAPKLTRVTPVGDGPFDLTPLSAREDLQLRRAEIKQMYQGLGSQVSVQIYLKEAYNLIPTFLGYGLQRNGFYEEALLWYRQVYDYLQPGGGAKIDYNLKLEQSLKLSYEDSEEWLNDASNAHAVAATRKKTYTRHILLMIIRCLVEYADALFSRDNVTDNTRARELYSMALNLLDRDALKSGSSSCANIIGQLEIDVAGPGLSQLEQFKPVLEKIQNPDLLSSVVISLRNISQDTGRPAVDRLADMRETVVASLGEVPGPKRMADVLETKRQAVATIENRFLADQSHRILLTKIHQRRRQAALTSLSEVADRSEDVLLEAAPLPWLRQARPVESGDELNGPVNLALFHPDVSRRLAVLSQVKSELPMASLAATHAGGFTISDGISFDFCIPQNPVIQALRTRAWNNLSKLRSCRNIAGFVRQLDPYGAPVGVGSGMVSPDGTIFSGIVDAPPTAYRYAALIARAKDLVGVAQQIEANYQAALENAEREALSVLQAEQNVEMAQARVSLQDLRIRQANNELGLAQLQKSSAVLREETYAGWIAGGKNEYEVKMLSAYSDAAEAQKQAARAGAAASVAQSVASIAGAWSIREVVTGAAVAQTVALTASIASTLAEATFQERAINAEASAQAASFEASFERRNDEWRLQQGLAALDTQIGDQQIALAQNQIEIVQQERLIAGLEQTHAIDVLNFLLSKTFTEEMYRWIASVLEDVYRFFLQEATVTSKLAEKHLSFERQQGQLKVIQPDYWDLPADPTVRGNNVDRLGLTGSARLLKDIFRLDNYAFETRRRKQALTLMLDLAAMFPVEFQRFRETGVLIFNTPQSLIDRQMPGYYLSLIQQVSVSVVALIPPVYGIRATLTSSGLSRVVVGGDTFQTVTIRNLPERVALTSATTTSGAIALEPDGQSLLNPFEGSGFDTLWELRMPKAANPFDYNTMATVLFTVNMTALHSFDYEREVIGRLDQKVSFDRAFDFRQVFADPWYDLNNPDQADTPMVVRFETRRGDFPPNLSNLTIKQVALYLIRRDGEAFEQPIRHLHFTPAGMNGAVGGPASTVGGRVSTRSGNGANWLPLIGQLPYGVWELAFPDQPPADTAARDRFANELIESMLLVITVSGQSPAFPA